MSTRRCKREGEIEAPSGTISDTRVHVLANGKHMIITTYVKQQSVQIYIGSGNTYCIDAQLYKDETGEFLDTGILNKIRWDADCASDKSFEQGEDTIMILQLLMTYIKDTYPAIKKIWFTDLSTKKCDNNVSVNLAAMKFFTVGKTWYEDRFHAIIAPESAEMYERMINAATVKKTTMTWEDAKRYIKISTLDIHESLLQKTYEETKTWQQWFSWILETMQHVFQSKKNNAKTSRKKAAAQFCIWLSQGGWFDTFVQIILQFNTMGVKFILDPRKFSLTYDIQHGGKRRQGTQKRRR